MNNMNNLEKQRRTNGRRRTTNGKQKIGETTENQWKQGKPRLMENMDMVKRIDYNQWKNKENQRKTKEQWGKWRKTNGKQRRRKLMKTKD